MIDAITREMAVLWVLVHSHDGVDAHCLLYKMHTTTDHESSPNMGRGEHLNDQSRITWKMQLWIQSLHIDGLVQDCRNSSALAMELLQSCTKPSISYCVMTITVCIMRGRPSLSLCLNSALCSNCQRFSSMIQSKADPLLPIFQDNGDKNTW